MEFLNFVRDEPVIGWFLFLAFVVTVVPAASMFWRTKFRSSEASEIKPPVQHTKSTNFGNRTELLILLIGLVCLLVLIGWISSFSG